MGHARRLTLTTGPSVMAWLWSTLRGLLSTSLFVAAAALVAACSGGDEPSAAPLTIKAQPADISIPKGESASFSIDAVGSGPLVYQWRRNGVPLPGANDRVYTHPAVSAADDGAAFSVVVSDGRATIASASAKVNAIAQPVAPTIVVPPADQAVFDGDMVSFSVTANGTAPLAYQWQYNGVLIPGATSATLTFKAPLAANGFKIRVVVTNTIGSVTSSEALLSVVARPVAPAIVSHPASTAVTAPAAATFSVTATGTAPLAYQWRRNGVAIAGANAATYSTPPTTTADSGTLFTVVVSNAAASVTSNPATMTVAASQVAPAITTQPNDQSVAEGQTASFSVVASGTGPLTYQWRRNGVNIAGANASVYTTPATTVSADNGAQYVVVVTNAVSSATSRVAALTVTNSTSTYLDSLLANTPQGGWVKANVNTFSAAWPTGADLPPPTPSGPQAVLYAWSGFAWDSRRSSLIIYGGGHANYVGNEVYVWQGSNGQWTRGTLPSRVNLSSTFVEGNGAPQSAHTYQTNSYAPLVDRFVVFGGASWSPTGAALADANGRTGPWWWDPSKADPQKVGGQDGTGWDPSRMGSNAWQMRPDVPWLGFVNYPGFIHGTSAHREEGGHDVIYVTMDQNASGWPNLYRYQLGTTPSMPDVFQRVGAPSGQSVMASGAAAIDSRNGLFVRTAMANLSEPWPAPGDLAVWRLSNNNPINPDLNRDVAVQLFDEYGQPVNMNFASSIAYDSGNDQFVIWDSRDRGTVWITQSTFNVDGSIAPIWTVRRVPSTTTAQPVGNHNDGVLGKWKYVAAIRAFVALDSTSNGDIWLYRPPARGIQ